MRRRPEANDKFSCADAGSLGFRAWAEILEVLTEGTGFPLLSVGAGGPGLRSSTFLEYRYEYGRNGHPSIGRSKRKVMCHVNPADGGGGVFMAKLVIFAA